MLDDPKAVARFQAKIDRRGPDDCWPWTGWKTGGYGRFDVGDAKFLATQIALELDGRPRPSSKHFALHGDCTNPACCNPRHLRWGTKLENTDDRDRLGHRTARKGASHPLAKLTEDDVRYIRAKPASQRKLAARFQITQAAVSLIQRRINWAHVA